MKKQSSQIAFLVSLLVVWAVMAYRLKVIGHSAEKQAEIAKAKSAKNAQQENPLNLRFHRIRGEMDALYHYRIKPVPFDGSTNPFRIPSGMAMTSDNDKPAEVDSTSKSKEIVSVAPVSESDFGEALLKKVISAARFEGVVTLNNVSQININGQLHKEGDVFTIKFQSRLVLLKVKRLTSSYVTLALEDPDNGSAEQRVHLQ